MAPHIDTRTWTYGAVSHCTLTQNTADANYMLLTVVVNGHNCAVLLSAALVMDGNATCERYRTNQRAQLQRRCTLLP